MQRPGRGCLSYLIASEGEAVVVDPAPDAAYFAALADERGARITQVIDTHIHADHLSGARALAEATGAKLRLSEPALERGLAYADQVVPIADGEEIALGATTLRVLALPGHTTDMTGIVVGERAVISGDSLFADGIARPDLQRGDPEGRQGDGAAPARAPCTSGCSRCPATSSSSPATPTPASTTAPWRRPWTRCARRCPSWRSTTRTSSRSS